MESFTDYLPTLLIFAGLAMLAIEVGVLGFSIMILFFIGLGCLATGLLMLIGVIPPTLSAALLGSGLLSLIAALGLWKPLKNLQNTTDSKTVTSDLIGYTFELDSDISPSSPGQVKFSGINWKVISDGDIKSGTEVEVRHTAVGVLTVKPVSSP